MIIGIVGYGIVDEREHIYKHHPPFEVYHDDKIDCLSRNYKNNGINKHGKAFVDCIINHEIAKIKQEKESSGSTLIKALIDVSAEISAIDETIANYFNFEQIPGPFEKSRVPHIYTFTETKKVNASIHIPNHFNKKEVINVNPVVKKLFPENYYFIIGWDILKHCQLTYNCKGNNTFKIKLINPKI